MSVKVRYGRVKMADGKVVRKNTLVTIRIDDELFFGISRCNLDEDSPDKFDGRSRAAIRAEIAQGDHWNTFMYDSSFELHKSGLIGCVNVGEREKLFNYFDNIDEIQKERGRYR